MGVDTESAIITSAYTTSQFRDSFKHLKRSAKKGEYTCGKDICDRLNNRPIDEIEQFGPRLKGAGGYSFYKIRVSDSGSNNGKSGSYRIIVGIRKTPPEITITYIYIKRGSKGVENISNEFLKELVKEFLQERNSGELVCHKLAENLIEI